MNSERIESGFVIDLKNGEKWGCYPVFNELNSIIGFTTTIEAEYFDRRNGMDIYAHKDFGLELISADCCDYDFSEIDSDIVNIKNPCKLTIWCPERQQANPTNKESK